MRKYFVALLTVLGVLIAAPGFSAINNQNNPHVAVISLGSPSADLLLPGAYFGKVVTITGVHLLNGATIAASDTNYVKLELKAGSNIVAELDSRAAHENGLTLNTAEALNLVAAYLKLSASQVLTVNYDETDAGSNVALTDAQLVVEYFVN